MNGAADIELFGLILTAIFVLISGGVSLWMKLKLEKELLIGTVRAIVQLVLMGYVLTFVFSVGYWYVVLPIYAVMILFASLLARDRIGEKKICVWAPTFVSMFLSYMIVAWLVMDLIVDAQPWYAPRYFIPLGGMIIGNSMNAISIAVERLLSDLRTKKQEVELYLTLGADRKQASQNIFTKAIKAGMVPSINSLMGVGVVFIPGMMTGQIIAGSDPLLAVKYQLVVMFMLVGSTALGSVLVVSWIRSRCFDEEDRLVV